MFRPSDGTAGLTPIPEILDVRKHDVLMDALADLLVNVLVDVSALKLSINKWKIILDLFAPPLLFPIDVLWAPFGVEAIEIGSNRN